MSTFVELQNLVISGRFSGNDRTDVKAWLNTIAARIWAGDAANGGTDRWSFNDSDPVALTLTAGTRTATVPTTLRAIDRVYNELGDEIDQITKDEFFARYQADYVTGARGKPNHWAVINRTVYLGPTPDATVSFACTGRLVYGHDNGSAVFTAGDMSADTDKPWWDASHHYVLVAGAKMHGTKLRNDPTYPAMESEYRSLLTAMVDELAEDHGIQSYGVRDPL